MIKFFVRDDKRRILWQGNVERLRLAVDQVLVAGEKVEKASWDDMQTYGSFELRKNDKVRIVTVSRNER